LHDNTGAREDPPEEKERASEATATELGGAIPITMDIGV
jgi:hypothetical protein